MKPYILIVAGHRSTSDPGNPTERALTEHLARDYTRVFRDAGYEADWWQRDLDRDSDPDMTFGNLTTVAIGAHNVLAQRARSHPDQLCVMLDLHYNGAHSPFHVIVADNVGLRTAMDGGDVASDIAANNTLDVRLARAIATEAVTATGLAMYRGRLGIPGVMSERDTGVALDGDWRLGMLAATASQRMTAIRLVVEHGGYEDTPARQPGFTQRCAEAAVRAVNDVFDVEWAVDKPDERRDPPSALGYPAGMSRKLATVLFDRATGDDGCVYGFDEHGPVSTLWLETGKTSGRFPALTAVFHEGDAKYFVFGDGSVIWQPDTSAPVTWLGAQARAA